MPETELYGPLLDADGNRLPGIPELTKKTEDALEASRRWASQPHGTVEDLLGQDTGLLSARQYAEYTKDLVQNSLDGTDGLADVAFSGNYSDLSGTPDLADYLTSEDLGDLSLDWSDVENRPSFASVAETGQYADLEGTPDLSGFLSEAPVQSVNGMTGEVSVSTFSGEYADLEGSPSLANVAESGQYSDLEGTPAIPSAVSDLENDTGFITGYYVTGDDVTQHQELLTISRDQITDLPPSGEGHEHPISEITGLQAHLDAKPDHRDLFSGAYADLSGAPDLSQFLTGYTVTETDVTQHQDALAIDASQVSGLPDSSFDPENYGGSLAHGQIGSAGSVQFNDGGVLAGSEVYYDSATGGLGIGVHNPEGALDALGAVSVRARTGEEGPILDFRDESGDSVAGVSREGGIRGQRLSLGVPMQPANPRRLNAVDSPEADHLWAAGERFESWHTSSYHDGWRETSPFSNDFSTAVTGTRGSSWRLYTQLGQATDGQGYLWVQTAAGASLPASIRVGLLRTDGSEAGWGVLGASEYMTYVGEGLWKMESPLAMQEASSHSGIVLEFTPHPLGEMNAAGTASDGRAGLQEVQLYGEGFDKTGGQGASLTKHSAPDLARRYTWGGQAFIDPDGTISAKQFIENGEALAKASELFDSSTLSEVATTGSYSDLTGTPAIPTATSDLENDSGFIAASEAPVTSVNGKTGAVEVANFSGAYADLTGKPDLSAFLTEVPSTFEVDEITIGGKGLTGDGSNLFYGTTKITGGGETSPPTWSGIEGDQSLVALSGFQNDSGFITEAPVSSVNGQTGAVEVSLPAFLSGSGISGEWLKEIVQSFSPSSTSRDEAGRITSQEGSFRDGSLGLMNITRDVEGAASEIAYTHSASGQTVTKTIVRDAGGSYQSTQVSIS